MDATVRVLAREPRPAGSEAESKARAYCADRLRSAGYSVREEPFEYSAFVGRWATSIGGIVALAIVLSAAVMGGRGSAGVALALLTLGAVALAVVGQWMAQFGVLTFPAERRHGVNLVATRGDANPRVWLMAHLDSKSQPVPILLRAAGVTVLGATWITAIGVAAFAAAGVMAPAPTWGVLSIAAFVGALPVIATTVGTRSPGALDNASGVATILAAAEATGATDVGVCLTSAEELGLPGARAWVLAGGRSGVSGLAINCDGIDDDGQTTCMYSGRKPTRLVAAVLAAAQQSGSVVRAHRIIPGVLTDGVALADAGWDVVTLSKGGVRTLARIHTPADRAEAVTGRGIEEVARIIVSLLGASVQDDTWKS
jgi:acetylornithine deacetylase/succinyl-diaminopimelate desuccinylase-like protein